MLKLLLKYDKWGPFFPQKERKKEKPPLNKPFATPLSHNIELLLPIGPLHPFLKKYE